MIFADLNLARRLERAEARAGADFVAARARMRPESGARWIEVAGTYAMFDGPRSPVTQTFGLGLFEPPAQESLEAIETFFKERHAPVIHEVCPLAGVPVFDLLCRRGYRPVELTSVMYLPLAGRMATAGNPQIRVRATGSGEHEVWAKTAAAGWSDAAEFSDLLMDLMLVRADALSFLAELDGRPAAAASLSIHKGVGLLAGASTIPEFRNQGAQKALLEARLQHAAEAGCDVAMMCAAPGSGSQRNAERQGFRIAYTRVKWGLT